MRIEPVYLLAKEANVSSMPTRRVFLCVGGAFVAGAAVGGACVHSLAPTPEPAMTATPDLKPSGNAELDELRRLAVKAPIEELVARQLDFLDLFGLHYRQDQILWSGIERLLDHVVGNERLPSRRMVAVGLINIVEGGTPDFRRRFDPWLPKLRRIR